MLSFAPLTSTSRPSRFQSCSVMSRNRSRNSVKFDVSSIAIYALKWSVTPTFLSRNTFYLQLSLHCPKMNKKSVWEGKKNSRFLSARHRILRSCGGKASEIVVAKCKLILWGTSPVDYIHLIGPFKQYLADNIPLQSSNCNISGLAATVAFFANEAQFTQIWVFFRACSLQNEVGDPVFFYISDITNSSSFNGKIFRKKSVLENFRANVLNCVS